MEDERPTEETEELADKHEEGAFDGGYAVEAQSNGEDIAHEWQPGEESQPGTELVDTAALFLKRLTLDMEPTLYPFPASEPADAEGGEAANPVAEGADDEAAHGVAARKDHTGIERIGREGHDGGSQEGAEEESPEAVGL